jgi:hypothetical protein
MTRSAGPRPPAAHVFALRGTGAIGLPTVQKLPRRGHYVWALARSGVLSESGAILIAGDIASFAKLSHATRSSCPKIISADAIAAWLRE